ncbi:MAG: TraR/DksA C4-type zinc finger protein [bacterium]|nr:TraR/DksA C4-type zinc finger protein [bacterium]
MKAADKKKYKERLLLLRGRLRGDVSSLAQTAMQASGGGNASASSQEEGYEQEFTFSLMQTEEETLQQIENALERIEEGVYGSCIECSARIPKTRLNVIPQTAYCVKCASELE